MRGGWVRLHRRLLDHWIMEHPQHLKAWLWILMTAPYETITLRIPGGGITVPRGHVLVSARHAAREWGATKSTASRLLARLEAEGMLRSVSRHARAGTLYEIVSYETYQSNELPRGNGSGSGAPPENQGGPRTETPNGTPSGPPRSSDDEVSPAPSGRELGREAGHSTGQDEERESLRENSTPLTPQMGEEEVDDATRTVSSAAGTAATEPAIRAEFPDFRRLELENGSPVYPAEFERWWSLHPKHPIHLTPKAPTYKAWRTIRIGGATSEELDRAQAAFRRSEAVKSGMITRADRWLRDGLWREYLSLPASASSSRPATADEQHRLLDEATSRWVESGGLVQTSDAPAPLSGQHLSNP